MFLFPKSHHHHIPPTWTDAQTGEDFFVRYKGAREHHTLTDSKDNKLKPAEFKNEPTLSNQARIASTSPFFPENIQSLKQKRFQMFYSVALLVYFQLGFSPQGEELKQKPHGEI